MSLFRESCHASRRSPGAVLGDLVYAVACGSKIYTLRILVQCRQGNTWGWVGGCGVCGGGGWGGGEKRGIWQDAPEYNLIDCIHKTIFSNVLEGFL